jgi:hypothetical protein
MPDFDTSSGSANQVPSDVLTQTNTKTVSNKTISGSTNTLSNIPNSALLQITDKAKLEADIFYKDSNNDIGPHYVDLEEIAEPSSPAAGKSRLFRHSIGGEVKVKTSGGGVTTLQGGGASALTGLSDVLITSPTNQQYVRWNTAAGKWLNETAFPAGEANTISNIGTTGQGIFKQKTAADLELYKLNSLTAKLTIALDAPNNKIDFDIASTVATNDNSLTLSNKTININTNTIQHSTTNTAGDILKNNGTSYQRLARGSALQMLRVNSGGTDLEWATAGSGDVVSSASNTFGDFDQVFRSGRLDLRNPANTFSYNFTGSAIATDRNIILPLLTGNDTVVCEAHTQTLTNKTLTTPIISSISNSGTLTLPVGAETIVGRATTDTLTNKTVNATNNTITDTSQATGDLLKNNGSKFVRMAKGTGLQVLRTNSGATDLEWATLDNEKVGKAQANGNGSTTVFNIAHGMGSTPTYAFVSVAQSGTTTPSIARSYTVDSTNIVVTFASAPSSGTNNVVIYWQVVA